MLKRFTVVLAASVLLSALGGCGADETTGGGTGGGGSSSPNFALGQSSTSAASDVSAGLNSPGQMALAGSKVIVADSNNNRVLIWNSMPASAMIPADVVIGAASVGTIPTPTSIVNSSILNHPTGVASDGTKLVVIDGGNYRVLIWNTIPTVSGMPADVVLGQINTSTANTIQTTSASTVSYNAMAATISGTKLIISDTNNNRVMIWNTVPTTNNVAADVILGQSTVSGNGTGSGAGNLNRPMQTLVYGTKLLVVDSYNCRIMAWNTIPTSTGTVADYAIFQSSTSGTACGSTGTAVQFPQGIAVASGGQLFVADSANHRILRFAAFPTTNGGTVTSVNGQTGGTANSANRGTTVTQNSVNSPSFLLSNSTSLMVSDSNNNRILKWTTAPTGAELPDVQLGQLDWLSNAISRTTGGASATNLLAPSVVRAIGSRLFVVDRGNNRVLIYSTIPTANTAATVVLGQPNFTGSAPNNGGLSGSTLWSPSDVYSDGTKVVVADYGNGRVLIWNSIPTSNGQAADVVLGQPSMTSFTQGYEDATSTPTPNAVLMIGTRLFVGDSGYGRITVWNTIPTVNNTAANYALGVADLTSSQTFDKTKEFGVGGLATDGTRLFVADNFYYRVAVFNSIPTSNYPTIDFVLGQPTLTSSAAPSPVSLTAFGQAGQISYSNGVLFMSDTSNNRALSWNTITGSFQQAATHYLGQTSTSGVAPNAGTRSSTSLWSPGTSAYVGTQVFTADSQNNRILAGPYSDWK